MDVVVLGSTGQLAHDLLRVFPKAVGLNHLDVDVTDPLAVARTLEVHQPHWVINSAAFNRVDECESNPSLAFQVNAVGALHVARAAAELGAGVVYFSSDYVFGGDAGRRKPYVEDDVPRPLNVYGASKCAGEQLVMQSNPRHLVIRSTGLFGTSTSRKGWTFPELILNKARSEGRLRVVHDQVVSPTSTADLAAKVKELVDRECTGLFHLTNTGACSWFEFAREVLELAGVDARLEPISTAQSRRPALRPVYSALTSTRLVAYGLEPMRSRRAALADYLRDKMALSAAA